jgi:hypothetical protein
MELSTPSFPAQLVRTRLFTLGVPQQFTITAGGSAVLFLRSRAGDDPVTCLWALDLSSAAERLLADPAGLTGSSAGAGPASDGAGPASDSAGPASDSAGPDLGDVRRLPAEGPVTDPRPDPGGRRIAYVSDGSVRVIEAGGTGDRLLMAPDGPDVTAGIGERTGVAGPGGMRGYWWAPDGDRLLVARVDSSGVGLWYVADPANPANLQVSAVLGVDGEEVLFTGSQDPLVTHLWTYRAGDGVRRLTDEPAVHSGVRAGGVLVRVARGGALPGGQVTMLRDGQPAIPVASLAEQPVLDVHVTPLILGPRELRAMLYLPSWYHPGDGQLPILADPYGGAGRQRVTAGLDWRCLVSQWFAEQGLRGPGGRRQRHAGTRTRLGTRGVRPAIRSGAR